MARTCAKLGARCLGAPRRGHLRRRFLGVQGAWLGRLVGLGSRGELFARAVARGGRPRPPALGSSRAPDESRTRASFCHLLLCACALRHVPRAKRPFGRLLRAFFQRHGRRPLARRRRCNRSAGGAFASRLACGKVPQRLPVSRASKPRILPLARLSRPDLSRHHRIHRHVDAASHRAWRRFRRCRHGLLHQDEPAARHLYAACDGSRLLAALWRGSGIAAEDSHRRGLHGRCGGRTRRRQRNLLARPRGRCGCRRLRERSRLALRCTSPCRSRHTCGRGFGSLHDGAHLGGHEHDA